MDLQTEQGWYAPEVDRKVLKSLMKRNNAFALMNYGIWLLLLITTALVVISTWGSKSGMMWLIVYSVIHQSATRTIHRLLTCCTKQLRDRVLMARLAQATSLRLRQVRPFDGRIAAVTQEASLLLGGVVLTQY